MKNLSKVLVVALAISLLNLGAAVQADTIGERDPNGATIFTRHGDKVYLSSDEVASSKGSTSMLYIIAEKKAEDHYIEKNRQANLDDCLEKAKKNKKKQDACNEKYGSSASSSTSSSSSSYIPLENPEGIEDKLW